jgi:hypothetical protein
LDIVAFSLIIIGLILCLFPLRAAKGLGVVLLFAGAGLHITGIEKLTIENVLRLQAHMETEIQQIITHWTPPQVPIQSTGERVAAFAYFKAGGSKIEKVEFERPDDYANATEALEHVCKTLPDSSSENVILLIIGKTDRLPLRGPILRQYDANVGLALARASEVKRYLRGQCWDKLPNETSVLLLPSGPLHTPKNEGEKSGYPEDRGVDIWLLRNVQISAPNLSMVQNTGPTDLSTVFSGSGGSSGGGGDGF